MNTHFIRPQWQCACVCELGCNTIAAAGCWQSQTADSEEKSFSRATTFYKLAARTLSGDAHTHKHTHVNTVTKVILVCSIAAHRNPACWSAPFPQNSRVIKNTWRRPRAELRLQLWFCCGLRSELWTDASLCVSSSVSFLHHLWKWGWWNWTSADRETAGPAFRSLRKCYLSFL